MTLITSLFSDFLPYIAGAVALLGAWLGNGALNRRKGRKQAIQDAQRNSRKRQKRGQDAVSGMRGADRDDYIDSLRDNEGRWD